MFLGPHHIAAGGVSGLGILLEAALGFDRAIVILVLNIVMYVHINCLVSFIYPLP